MLTKKEYLTVTIITQQNSKICLNLQSIRMYIIEADSYKHPSITEDRIDFFCST